MWAYQHENKSKQALQQKLLYNWPRLAIIENSGGKRYTISDMDLVLFKKYIKLLGKNINININVFNQYHSLQNNIPEI